MESSESESVSSLESRTPGGAERAPPVFPSSPNVDQARERLADAIIALAATRLRDQRNTPSPDPPERVMASSGVAADANALSVQVRTSVSALARSLRTAGLPPERMLTLVKLAVTEADPDILREPAGRLLMSDVVRWSIEAFYAA